MGNLLETRKDMLIIGPFVLEKRERNGGWNMNIISTDTLDIAFIVDSIGIVRVLRVFSINVNFRKKEKNLEEENIK